MIVKMNDKKLKPNPEHVKEHAERCALVGKLTRCAACGEIFLASDIDKHKTNEKTANCVKPETAGFVAISYGERFYWEFKK